MAITKKDIDINRNFFEAPKENSKIKAFIVSNYFPKYCQIICKKHMPQRFGYFDLFAGPGVYDDGTLSTPILVAQNCVEKDWLREHVWLVFNDYYFSEDLKKNFDEYIGIDTFPNKPHFGHSEVGVCKDIDNFILKSWIKEQYNECPAILFFDPFGYKTINTNILCQFMQYWGNEIFLFFNTKRITPALSNEKFDEDMKVLFPRSFDETRERWNKLSHKHDRLLFLVESLKLEFEKQLGKKLFCTPFQFMEDDTNGTSHFLLHFTKNKRGYDLVKQIMDEHGKLTALDNGILSYIFDGKVVENELTRLFNQTEYNEIISNLANDLVNYISKLDGTISTLELFDNHQIMTQYSRRHYLRAMRKLVDDKIINATFTDGKKHKVNVTLSDSCIIKLN